MALGDQYFAFIMCTNWGIPIFWNFLNFFFSEFLGVKNSCCDSQAMICHRNVLIFGADSDTHGDHDFEPCMSSSYLIQLNHHKLKHLEKFNTTTTAWIYIGAFQFRNI